MFNKSSLTVSCAFRAGLFTALAVLVGAQSASAAAVDKGSVHHGYATHHWPHSTQSATLPYGPEYGFLTHIPPNAIRMPGYTFVPGVGILGESCDLPTSACPNEYRDVQ